MKNTHEVNSNQCFENLGRYIDAKIRREVRQRCGFGCVVCGNPIIQYDHMKLWSKVHEHVAGDITLLCPNHHMDATAGRLPRGKVLSCNENPFNKSALLSQKYTLWYYGDLVDFNIGGNIFKVNLKKNPIYRVLTILGHDVITAKMVDNALLIDLEILDENNYLILKVVENELIFSLANWDIQLIGNTLQINEKARKPRIIIRFLPPSLMVIEKAEFYFHGELVDVASTSLSYFFAPNSGTIYKNCVFESTQGGIIIG